MSYLLQYGELPTKKELDRWDQALRRHSALPGFVENAVGELPHDAHFMGIILTAINALSTAHPEQNPALAGNDVYSSKDIQDKQILRLVGKPSRGSYYLHCRSKLLRLMHSAHGSQVSCRDVQSPKYQIQATVMQQVHAPASLLDAAPIRC